MQRTVGPCHRDRKQKRNEKGEDATAGGGGAREGEVSQVGERAPSRYSSVVGQLGQEGTRQQALPKGVDYMKGAGHLALGRGRKGNLPRPQ